MYSEVYHRDRENKIYLSRQWREVYRSDFSTHTSDDAVAS